MLFGNKSTRECILEEAKKIARKENVELVFGAMVGSISQGVHNIDSDYDTRFLYINPDFPEKIYFPDEYEEQFLVKRYFPDEDLFYDKIPLWEMTSFLQFLQNPSMEKKFSIGLYHLVGWTFHSPYLWDPYGLANKILPMINKIFQDKYELQYQKEKIEEFFHRDEKLILIKDYLYSIIAAASIRYIARYHAFPPVHIAGLLGMDDDVRIKILAFRYIEDMRKKGKELYEGGEKYELKGSHYKVFMEREPYVDEYIEKSYQLCSELLKNETPGIQDNRKIINNIYDTINMSRFENTIKFIGDYRMRRGMECNG